MKSVPRQAYYIGLAGVLPYLGTSLSTVFCAWEINHSVGGIGAVMSSQTAETFLHILEPLQVGYGAVVGTSYHAPKLDIDILRYYRSLVPSTGAWSLEGMVVIMATDAMQLVS